MFLFISYLLNVSCVCIRWLENWSVIRVDRRSGDLENDDQNGYHIGNFFLIGTALVTLAPKRSGLHREGVRI